MRTRFLLIAMAVVFATTSHADEDRANLRIQLQASMQRHIDRTIVDGAFLAINLENGLLDRYFPTKAHTQILEGDGYFVLCADMRDESGQSIPVDYYMAKSRRGFKVFRTEIGNRKPLQTLMKSGDVWRF